MRINLQWTFVFREKMVNVLVMFEMLAPFVNNIVCTVSTRLEYLVFSFSSDLQAIVPKREIIIVEAIPASG